MKTSFLTALPLETVLDIITYVPWTQETRGILGLTCRGLEDIMRKHEPSIAREVIAAQYTSCRLWFPDPAEDPDSRPTYKRVHKIQTRQRDLTEIENSCMRVEARDCKQSPWMTARNIKLQRVGLGLLYRLADAECDKSRAKLLKSLPTVSLALLLFATEMSIHQLHAEGLELLSGVCPECIRRGVVDVSKHEIALAFQQLLLQRGPGYLASLLRHDAEAIRALEEEHQLMEVRQMPLHDDTPSPPTLIATLRRSLVASLGCHFSEHYARMWGVINSKLIRDMNENDAEKIIRGETIGQ